MWRRALAGRKRRFGETLIFQSGVGRVEKFADLRAVSGDERLNCVAVLDGHGK